MDIKMHSLNKICEIRTGFQFREQLKQDPEGEYQVLQMRDINNENEIAKESAFAKTDIELNDQRLLLRDNDIIFRARGYNNYATLVTGLVNKTVVPSHFFILRVKNEVITPDYLVYYINSRIFQHDLKSYLLGSNIPMITKNNLGSLKIRVPDLELQNKIAKINNLAIKEQQILEQVKITKKKMIETILENMLVKGT